MTPVEVAEVLAYASAAHPYISLSKETVSVYADLLADLDYEATKRAVRRLSASNDRVPSPAVIRKEVARLAGVLPPDASDALTEVLMQMEKHSRQLALEAWSHPIVEEVVRSLGGLYRFRMSEQPDTLRAHFLRVYDKATDKHERATVLSRGANEIGLPNEKKRAITQNATQTEYEAPETHAVEAETI